MQYVALITDTWASQGRSEHVISNDIGHNISQQRAVFVYLYVSTYHINLTFFKCRIKMKINYYCLQITENLSYIIYCTATSNTWLTKWIWSYLWPNYHPSSYIYIYIFYYIHEWTMELTVICHLRLYNYYILL